MEEYKINDYLKDNPELSEEFLKELAKYVYALSTIDYICKKLKENRKKKVDIDNILRITKEVLNG